jgi:hypothetical protein
VPRGLFVDTQFDLRAEAGGRDPDGYSKTLRLYHQLLWSMPLPSGDPFNLDANLCHKTQSGVLRLSSDTIAATYARWNHPCVWSRSSGQHPPTRCAP